MLVLLYTVNRGVERQLIKQLITLLTETWSSTINDYRYFKNQNSDISLFQLTRCEVLLLFFVYSGKK